jgi:hypothetical protein
MRNTVVLVCLGCAVTSLHGQAPAARAALAARGRTFHVARAHPQAADTSDGSAATPWKSLSRAVREVGPGDTVLVHSGIYREAVRVEKSGSGPDGTITFRAMPGENVVISGAEVVSGWRRASSEPKRAIWEADWRWPSVFPSMLTADDQPLAPLNVPAATEELKPPKAYCRYFLGVGRGRAAMVPGSFFFDEPRGKVLVWLKADGDPNAHQIEAAVRAPWGSAGNFLRVEGFGFRYAPLVTPVGGVVFVMAGPGVGASSAEGCVVRNCEVSLGAFEGMYVRGGARTTTLVEDCWVHHNGNGCGGFEGLGAADTNAWLIVRRCRFTDNNLFHWNPCWHAGGKHFGKRVFFDECEFARSNFAPGVWFDCGERDCIVNRCYAHDNGQFGLYYEIGETGAFLNNVVEGSPSCWAVALAGCSRSLVAHNLIKAPGRGVSVGGEGSADGAVARVACYNAVWNNVLLGANDPLIAISPEGDITRGNQSDGNLLWRLTAPASASQAAEWPLFEYGAAAETKASLPVWQRRRRLDLASRVADPRVSMAGGRFWPAAESPMASGGKHLSREIIEKLFCVKPMPAIGSDVGSASIKEHLAPSRAFLDKVTELVAVADGQAVPVGPLPHRATATPLAVPNGGFEQPRIETDGGSGSLPIWRIKAGSPAAAFVWRASGTGLWNWYPPDGNQVLVVTAGEPAPQPITLSLMLEAEQRPNTRYEVRLWAGQRINDGKLPWPRVSMALCADTALLKEQEIPAPRIGSDCGVWIENLLVFESGPSVPPGRRLVLRLYREANGPAQACFDRISVESMPVAAGRP